MGVRSPIHAKDGSSSADPKNTLEGEAALCLRIVSPEFSVISVYPEKKTRVAYSNENLESCETFPKRRITKCRRESLRVTGEASVSKDRRVKV